MIRASISHSDIPPAPRPRLERPKLQAPLPEPTIPVNVVLSAAHRLGPCTTEILLRETGHTITRANEMAVAATLRRLGYTRTRMMIKGVRQYVFYPPTR